MMERPLPRRLFRYLTVIVVCLPAFAAALGQEDSSPVPTEESVSTEESAPVESTLEAAAPEESSAPPPPADPAARASRPKTFEGRMGTFDFVAADPSSLQVARRIGRIVLDVCDELISSPDERIPTLSVKLVPDGRGDLDEELIRIYEDVAGDYGLAVAWNGNLPVSLFIQALTDSYLRQIVYTLANRDRAEDLPSWLIAAAALRAQAALRPALVEYFREFGREAPMLSLEELLADRPLEDLSAAERIGAFWFLELITVTFDNPKRIRNFFDAVVAGGAPLEVLQNQTRENPSFANGAEAWWVIGFQDLVHRQTGIVLSIGRSGRQLYLLNRFELLDGGRPAFTTVAGLWEYRKNPLIQRTLSDRLQEIRQMMPRVNPVFYNAFRSLGLQMQALLDDDREAFEASTEEFSDEIATATALARDARILAEDPDAEI